MKSQVVGNIYFTISEISEKNYSIDRLEKINKRIKGGLKTSFNILCKIADQEQINLFMMVCADQPENNDLIVSIALNNDFKPFEDQGEIYKKDLSRIKY